MERWREEVRRGQRMKRKRRSVSKEGGTGGEWRKRWRREGQ